MQDVDNDMDDLFRKAAERYPLKTDGADWQKVLAGLQAASAPVAEEKQKRRMLWLFLLPLGLLWSVYYKSDNQPVQKGAIVKDGNLSNKESYSSLQKPDLTHTEKLFSKEKSKDHRASSSSENTKNNVKTSAVADDRTLSAYNNKERLHNRNKPGLYTAGFARLKNKGNAENKQAATGNRTNIATDDKNNFFAPQPISSFTRIDKENTEELAAGKVIDSLMQSKADSTALNTAKKDSSANNTSSSNKSAQIKVKPHEPHGFYGGLLAGFDVSTVKLQRINKTGYGLQVLAGYHFSNHLSIETGLGWSLKNYYSKGKYFDKKKAHIPDALNIYFTNGYCKMLEVPFSVKYDFALHKKSNLFTTAGLSSYFMKKESYSYPGDFMGWPIDTTRNYSNSGKNLFSIASLSIGYQLQLNRNLSLRVEPYIKVPLHGIGIANLPIASMGISAGFTRKF